MGEECARIVMQFVEKAQVEGEAFSNRAKPFKHYHTMMVRYLNKAGALMPALAVLAQYGISIEEMENVVMEGREACVTRFILSGGNVHNIKEIICEQIMAENADLKILGVEFQP